MIQGSARWRRRSLVAAVTAFFVCGSHASAQDAPQRATGTFVAGALQYDLSGTGTTGFVGVRVDRALRRLLLLEAGVTYAQYTPDVADKTLALLFPEVQLQLQGSSSRLRPFVGAGIGPAFTWGGGETNTELSLSAGVGARYDMSDVWGLRGEIRLRTIDPFVGSAAEWTAGISRRF